MSRRTTKQRRAAVKRARWVAFCEAWMDVRAFYAGVRTRTVAIYTAAPLAKDPVPRLEIYPADADYNPFRPLMHRGPAPLLRYASRRPA